MRERQSARLLVLDPEGRVLLFRFVHQDGVLAGKDYWATPGGGLEAGESFAQAAIRELREETGLCVSAVDAPVAERQFELLLPSGERVLAVERYFVVRAASQTLSSHDWTTQEAEVIADHRWWSIDALRETRDVVWPQGLVEMLREARAL